MTPWSTPLSLRKANAHYQARTVVLRSSHADDVLCISTPEGCSGCPSGSCPTVGTRRKRGPSRRRPAPASMRSARPEEHPPRPRPGRTGRKSRSYPARHRHKAKHRADRAHPPLAGRRPRKCGVSRLRPLAFIATIDGKGLGARRRVVVFDAKRHAFLDVALGRTRPASSFVGDGSTQIHAPPIVRCLVQVGGSACGSRSTNRTRTRLKPQIGVRIRVNGPRSFKRRPFRGWVHFRAFPAGVARR